MNRTIGAAVAVVTSLLVYTAADSGGVGASGAGQARPAARQVPQFQVDPAWPKVPGKWVLGLVSGVTVDERDHIWVLHRPRTVKPEQKGMAAPPVLEFDVDGTFIQAWGGPGAGYEWPDTEHGISFDHKGFAWIAGSGQKDGQILKFTRDGKFVMQIGHAGQSKGNTDTANVHGAADVVVYPKTNEVFAADGYFNRRIIVFDADTGAFKRMWGAFANAPTDPPPAEGRGRGGRGGRGAAAPAADEEGPGADQFNLVHSARISNDGLVYVSDRANKRVQVFSPEGKYLTQVFISRRKAPPSTAPGMAFGRPVSELVDGLVNAGMTASRTAFSPDAEQRFLYVIDRTRQQIAVLERKSLEILGFFGGGVGPAPGQFYILHDIAVDSKGNVYTAEVNDNGNRRAQKFVYKGLGAPAPAN